MRVIAGKAKGTRLSSVKGLATRPTGDRVKEALFNILGPKVLGSSFWISMREAARWAWKP